MSVAGSDWEDITSESEGSVIPDEEEERGPEADGGQESREGFYGGSFSFQFQFSFYLNSLHTIYPNNTNK